MDYRTIQAAAQVPVGTLKAEHQPASEVPDTVRRRKSSLHSTGQGVFARKSNQDWQSVLRNGAAEVDILGAAVNTTATEIAEAPLFLELWDEGDCDWRKISKDDSGTSIDRVRAVYSRIIRLMTPTFRYRLGYALELVGEAWIIVTRGEGGELAGYNLAQSTALTFPEKDSGDPVKWTRYANGDDKDTVEVNESDVLRVFVPDPEFDLEAWTPYKSLCLTLEQLSLAYDLVHASLDELMYTAPILWMQLDEDDDEVFEAYKKRNDERAQARQATGPEARGIRASRKPVAVSSAQKPEYVVVGSDPNEETIRLIELMTLQVARASSQPTDVLMEGRSSANHWGSLHTARTHLTYTIGPRARIQAAALTATLLSPFLEDEDIGKFRIAASVDKLVNAQVNPAEVRQAYLTGAIPLACVAESVGKDAVDLNDWDEAEREHWLTVSKSQAVQADSRLAQENDTGETEEVGRDIADSESAVDASGGPRLVASGGRVVDDLYLLSNSG